MNCFSSYLKAAAAIFLSAAFQASSQSAAPVTNSAANTINPSSVLSAMEKVANWQLANPSEHRADDWTQGALYAGMMALSDLSGSPKYHEAMMQMAESNSWKPGPRIYHADDHCVGQTYVELYLQHREPRMIAPLKERFDFILANPRLGNLVFTNKGASDRWSWCDALFMAPPAWVRLYSATGDSRYREFAVSNWWKTSDFLYSKEEHIYFRDSTYFKKAESNGKKVFWGRGNGWVMGGLVRMLQYLPSNDPSYSRFTAQFREMAEQLLTCQQSDGLWRASLLDPSAYPLKETSGSGFFAYAFAWGVNQGLLDRARFEPAARKAWIALNECVAEDGKLTHVQPIGADPKKFNLSWTDVYGVGAYLLAGSEIYRLSALQNTPWTKVTVSNPASIRRENETVEVSVKEVLKRLKLPAEKPVELAVMDNLSSRVVDSQLLPDGKLLFQVDLGSAESRSFRIFKADALPGRPKPLIKTFARFVPERMDDFAWESDRIAHRMYGPALIPGEGTISSGVDVWAKRTRRLVLDDWYASKKYHLDRGEGLDFYHVGAYRGCGGLGLWDGKNLAVSSNFKTWKLIATGPVRSVFELTYDSWKAGDRTVSETKRISIDANSNFSREESVFSSTNAPTVLGIFPKKTLKLGLGISERKGEGVVKNNSSEGWLMYWEPALGTNGHIGCAVIAAPSQLREFTHDKAQFLAIAKAKTKQPFVYYLGAGWSKSGDFPDAQAWEACVRNFAQRVKSPVAVKFEKP